MSNWSELQRFLEESVHQITKDHHDLLWVSDPNFPASVKWILQTTSSQVSHIVNIICSFLIVAYADTLNCSQEQKFLIYKDWAWDDEFLGGLEWRLGTHFLNTFFLQEWWLWTRLVQFIQSNPRMLLRENVSLVYDPVEESISIHKFQEYKDTEENIWKDVWDIPWKKAKPFRLRWK
jgi:hypothetical protein